MKRYFRFYFSLFLTLIVTTVTVFAQESGENLFNQNCTACHSLGSNKLVGPGLKGVTDKYETEWLKKWIVNSQLLLRVVMKELLQFMRSIIKLPCNHSIFLIRN